MFKSARILARLQALLGWSYMSFELFQYSVFSLACIHWIACVWGIVGKVGRVGRRRRVVVLG